MNMSKSDKSVPVVKQKYVFGLLETPVSRSGSDVGTTDPGSSRPGPSRLRDPMDSGPSRPGPSKRGNFMDSGPSSTSGPGGLWDFTDSGPSRPAPGRLGALMASGSSTGPGPGRLAPLMDSAPSRPGPSRLGPVRNSTSTGLYQSSTSSLPLPGSARTPAGGLVGSVCTHTPGSRATPAVGVNPADRTAIVVAMIEGTGSRCGEVGIASINLKRPVLNLSQFSDSSTYVKTMTKLQITQPVEVIMPNTACEGSMTKLFNMIKTRFPNTKLSTVPKKYFNHENGLQYIKNLCLSDYTGVAMEVREKFYCLMASAALIKYIEFIQHVIYASKSLKIVFRGSEQTTMIDFWTVTTLELCESLHSGRSENTLFGVMNYTKSPMGRKQLRANILQPPCNVPEIEGRLAAVTELLSKPSLLHGAQAAVAQFLDLDLLLSHCVVNPKQQTIQTGESRIVQVIHVKHALDLIEPLADSLRPSQDGLIKRIVTVLEDPRFGLLREQIDTVLLESVCIQKGALNMRTQKCFALKPNINGLLDVARRTYSEIVDDIQELVRSLSEEHSLPLRVGYSNFKGFFIQVSRGSNDRAYTKENLPGVFIKVTRCKNTLSFTTTDMIKLNDRVNESLQEIYLMANVVLTELMKDAMEHFGCMYKLAESVATLDVLCALAQNSASPDYVRPAFTDTLAVKHGRHPILEKISVSPPVPNNTYACDGSNMVIITGPNMSGKSTYLRQIALLQVMAQVGSYVPAQKACFRVADQIFSRLSNSDDIESNASTFTVEMREMNYIVRNVSDKSLIIIDELGRGTAAVEGIGISHAIFEHLLAVKAFTFFATHYYQLTSLASLYPNVENYCFEIQRVLDKESNNMKTSFNHTIAKGKAAQSHSGLHLAKLATLPEAIKKNMWVHAEKISSTTQSEAMTAESRRRRAIFTLGTRVHQAAVNSKLDEAGTKAYLTHLKNQYLAEIRDIDGSATRST